ncbi:MAG: hypothetical protein LBV61_04105 [Burkholderiaceae bacterium]|jgi:Flp pilus assembly pilin Flp|nr:hypothetical protein [Burkholderiaceae bacterium]
MFRYFTNRSSARRRQRGQGMTEYIIIVALIAIAAIGVYTVFGNVVKGQTAAMAQELAGGNSSASVQAAADAATKGDTANQGSTLSTFTTSAKSGNAGNAGNAGN